MMMMKMMMIPYHIGDATLAGETDKKHSNYFIKSGHVKVNSCIMPKRNR